MKQFLTSTNELSKVERQAVADELGAKDAVIAELERKVAQLLTAAEVKSEKESQVGNTGLAQLGLFSFSLQQPALVVTALLVNITTRLGPHVALVFTPPQSVSMRVAAW